MPSYEQSLAGKRSATSFYSFDKVLATMNNTSERGGKPHSTMNRMGRFNITIKDGKSFYGTVEKMDAKQYKNSSAGDLSTLLMPFESTIGRENGLPCFHPRVGKTEVSNKNNILGQHILPFDWNPAGSGSTKITDRYAAPSGDSMRDYLSGDRQYGDINQFRDRFNVRGIGLRLPMMGVGWGYSLSTGGPMPSGTKDEVDKFPSGTKVFRGGTTKGWQVDPGHYIAAPIDFRYDEFRHVWTCGGPGLPPGSGIYKVITLLTDDNPGSAGWDYLRFPPVEPI